MEEPPIVEVRSEIGRLRQALVHEPGAEVDRMVPAMMEQLLFDDILYGERARDEHGRFRRVLQLLGIELFDATDLLAEALEQDAARRFVLDVVLGDLPERFRRGLEPLAAEALAAVLVTGSRQPAQGAGPQADELYELPPLPNWCFQRDPQVVLGREVLFAAMATAARHREGLLARTVFRFHPRFAGVALLSDPMEARGDRPLFASQERPSLEGGDVMVFSPDLLGVGISERTNLAGVKQLARALGRRSVGPRWLIAVEIPRRRAYMHLDTLITQVDRDRCLAYTPVLLPGGTESARVWEIDLHAADPGFATCGSLLVALARRGVDLEPIPCGGTDPVAQQREQWTDGANALALAPGLITLFDRNLATAEELSRRGFRIVEAEELLLGREEVDVDSGERVCILIKSHELSRARGGPHCLVHPLVRDAVE